MSIRPVAFHADGSIDVVFDERGHSGTIPAAEVSWGKNIDGTDNHNFIILACPDGCGGMSTHPVGGGAAPLEVQQMFVLKEFSAPPAGRATWTLTDAAAQVKARVVATDGEERWVLDDAALATLKSEHG
jgi:hypothetical protein